MDSNASEGTVPFVFSTSSPRRMPVLLAGACLLVLLAGVGAGLLVRAPLSKGPDLQLSAGSYHTCLSTNENNILCWGLDDSGQLGGGLPGPAGKSKYVTRAKQIAHVEVGGEHSCFIRDDGRLLCWGHNGNGQIGDGTIRQRWAPVYVVELPGRVLDVSIGRYHTCARLDDERVRCWGWNAHGQIGDGSTADSRVPRTIVDLDPVQAVAAGERHTCVLVEGGNVACWGDNSSGQLGDGTTTDRLTPVAVRGVVGAKALATGDRHTCVLTLQKTVLCWGRNEFHELGDGTNVRRPTPVEVVGVTGAIAITAGEHHTCALLSSGRAVCWGSNSAGQLGNETISLRDDYGIPPVRVALDDVSAIDAGGTHTCAIAGGRPFCWGWNNNGQVGDLDREPRYTPFPVDFVPGP
jgi:alpha-tubulin suppressor-like RCC1 family protein